MTDLVMSRLYFLVLSRKRTLNHLARLAKRLTSLAKWLSVHLQTKWFRVRIHLQSLELQVLRLLQAEFPDIQTTTEFGFTVKSVCGTDKYSEHDSIIRSVWLNG